MPMVDKAGFGEPRQLFDEIVEAFAVISEGEMWWWVRRGVEVLDEFFEAEGLAGEANAGFKGFEAGVARGGLGEEERAIFVA